MKLLTPALLLIVLFLSLFGAAHAETVPGIPLLIDALKIQEPVDFCGEKVPLDEQEVRERFEKELLLSLWDRAQVLLWLKRTRRYLPVVEKMLTAGGLPSDLKYVAVAESALLEHARSSKGAVGMWQFIEATGTKYGLTINRHLDERRDFLASTRAAVLYFQELYALFGTWTLSAAAYNMGEDRLSAEIQDQGTDNYYRLYLPMETQRFLFRILSAKLILSNPEAYGFILSDADFYPPVVFDEVQVKLKQETPIRILAKAAGTHYKAIRDLNPALRNRYLAEGNHALRLPQGVSKGFQARLDAGIKAYNSLSEKEVYVIRNGDSLSAIAERFEVPLASVLLWNRLDPRKPIHPGQRLFLYPKAFKKAPEEDGTGAETDS